MKIVTAFFKFDYGVKEMGESPSSKYIIPALKNQFSEIIPYYFEEHGYPSNLKRVRTELIDLVIENKPDFVFFIPFEFEIDIDTYRRITDLTKTACFFFDDDWRFEDWVSKIAPVVSHPVSICRHSRWKYQNIGVKNVIKGFPYSNEIVDEINYDYDYNVSFIGQKSLVREWYIEELMKKGITVDCFGPGWANGKVSYSEMKNIIGSSKINLNLSNSYPYDYRFITFCLKKLITLSPVKFYKVYRQIYSYIRWGKKKNIEQIKNRTIEIPSFGGFQLSHYGLDTEWYFEIGKEIAIYATISELEIQILKYLSNDKEREAIRSAGYQKSRNFTLPKLLQIIFKIRVSE